MIKVEVETNLGPLDERWFMDQCRTALMEASLRVNNDFRSATATWEHRPVFASWGPFVENNEIYIEAGPTSFGGLDKIFALVNAGARPHRITAKRVPLLRFRTGYQAKTTPLSLVSRPGGKSGPYRSKRSVSHPGFQPRNFGIAALDKHSGWWAKRVWKFAQFWPHGASRIRPMRRINI